VQGEACGIFKNDNLFDAKNWAIDDTRRGTPLNLHRQISPEVSKQLRFKAAGGEVKALFFDSDTELNVQATRGVREITPNTAALFERIIERTDKLPRNGKMIVVSAEVARQS